MSDTFDREDLERFICEQIDSASKKCESALEAVLTPDNVMSAVNRMFESKGFDLQAVGYSENEGTVTIMCIHKGGKTC